MKTQEINLGKDTIWLSIEPCNENTFMCFCKLNRLDASLHKNLLKDKDGRPIEFDTIKDVISRFKTKTNYDKPLNYSGKELTKIEHTPMRITYTEGEKIKEVMGIIVNYSVAISYIFATKDVPSDSANQPISIRVRTFDNEDMMIGIDNVQCFNNLS